MQASWRVDLSRRLCVDAQQPLGLGLGVLNLAPAILHLLASLPRRTRLHSSALAE